MNDNTSNLDKEVTSFIRSIVNGEKQGSPLFLKLSTFWKKSHHVEQQEKSLDGAEIDSISLDEKKPIYSLSIQLKSLRDLLLGNIELNGQEVCYLDEAESKIKKLSMFTRDKQRVTVIAKKIIKELLAHQDSESNKKIKLLADQKSYDQTMQSIFLYQDQDLLKIFLKKCCSCSLFALGVQIQFLAYIINHKSHENLSLNEDFSLFISITKEKLESEIIGQIFQQNNTADGAAVLQLSRETRYQFIRCALKDSQLFHKLRREIQHLDADDLEHNDYFTVVLNKLFSSDADSMFGDEVGLLLNSTILKMIFQIINSKEQLSNNEYVNMLHILTKNDFNDLESAKLSLVFCNCLKKINFLTLAKNKKEADSAIDSMLLLLNAADFKILLNLLLDKTSEKGETFRYPNLKRFNTFARDTQSYHRLIKGDSLVWLNKAIKDTQNRSILLKFFLEIEHSMLTISDKEEKDIYNLSHAHIRYLLFSKAFSFKDQDEMERFLNGVYNLTDQELKHFIRNFDDKKLADFLSILEKKPTVLKRHSIFSIEAFNKHSPVLSNLMTYVKDNRKLLLKIQDVLVSCIRPKLVSCIRSKNKIMFNEAFFDSCGLTFIQQASFTCALLAYVHKHPSFDSGIVNHSAASLLKRFNFNRDELYELDSILDEFGQPLKLSFYTNLIRNSKSSLGIPVEKALYNLWEFLHFEKTTAMTWGILLDSWNRDAENIQNSISYKNLNAWNRDAEKRRNNILYKHLTSCIVSGALRFDERDIALLFLKKVTLNPDEWFEFLSHLTQDMNPARRKTNPDSVGWILKAFKYACKKDKVLRNQPIDFERVKLFYPALEVLRALSKNTSDESFSCFLFFCRKDMHRPSYEYQEIVKTYLKKCIKSNKNREIHYDKLFHDLTLAEHSKVVFYLFNYLYQMKSAENNVHHRHFEHSFEAFARSLCNRDDFSLDNIHDIFKRSKDSNSAYEPIPLTGFYLTLFELDPIKNFINLLSIEDILLMPDQRRLVIELLCSKARTDQLEVIFKKLVEQERFNPSETIAVFLENVPDTFFSRGRADQLEEIFKMLVRQQRFNPSKAIAVFLQKVPDTFFSRDNVWPSFIEENEFIRHDALEICIRYFWEKLAETGAIFYDFLKAEKVKKFRNFLLNYVENYPSADLTNYLLNKLSILFKEKHLKDDEFLNKLYLSCVKRVILSDINFDQVNQTVFAQVSANPEIRDDYCKFLIQALVDQERYHAGYDITLDDLNKPEQCLILIVDKMKSLNFIIPYKALLKKQKNKNGKAFIDMVGRMEKTLEDYEKIITNAFTPEFFRGLSKRRWVNDIQKACMLAPNPNLTDAKLEKGIRAYVNKQAKTLNAFIKALRYSVDNNDFWYLDNYEAHPILVCFFATIKAIIRYISACFAGGATSTVNTSKGLCSDEKDDNRIIPYVDVQNSNKLFQTDQSQDIAYDLSNLYSISG